MLKSTRLGIYSSLNGTFTCAILPAHAAMRERSLFAILELRGDPILFSGDSADPSGSLPDWVESAMARLRAEARAHRSGVLFAQDCPAVPMQRGRAGAGAQPGFSHRIRLSKL